MEPIHVFRFLGCARNDGVGCPVGGFPPTLTLPHGGGRGFPMDSGFRRNDGGGGWLPLRGVWAPAFAGETGEGAMEAGGVRGDGGE